MALNSVKRARLAKFSPLEDLGTLLHGQKGCLQAVYDFAVLGGTAGDVELLDVYGEKAILPSGAIIQDVLVHVETAVTGAGGSLAIKAESAADVLAATVVANLTTGAMLDGVPVSTAATAILLTAERKIKGTIAAGLTAGKVHVFIDWVVRA